MLLGLLVLVIVFVVAVLIGSSGLGWQRVLAEIVAQLTGGTSPLSERDAAIIWELRVPRIVLAGLVGAALASAGACYQGVFRNPLADPYLLGAAAGAGMAATIVLVVLPGMRSWPFDPLPIAAFVGSLGGVVLTWLLGRSAGGNGRSSTATLLLAGVAVASFLTAVQTFVQQLNVDTVKDVYVWMLGGFNLADWADVLLALPYIALAAVVLTLCGRLLDVLALGDAEAASLGLRPGRIRFLVLTAASLATAAAVSVSGLIAFVGIVVPHIVRLLAGASYRVIVPLSLIGGAVFLIVADQLASTVRYPAELPIGVITAFTGAPFFALILRSTKARA
ncbi:MAG: iron chelate uptake ABC transporter family permease subunit [Pseudonocardiaceae bacterium]|nr:iron chelate uptake ABC transporter family permease subunit [Pseudonocardiaceae bacterium]